MLDGSYVAALRRIGTDQGLDALGIAPAGPFDGTRADLEERKAAGLNGSMQFTYRNPARSTDPAATLPSVASLVVGARRYHSADPEPSPAPGRAPTARVARYARSDHYAELRTGLDAVAARLRADGWTTRVVLDDNALVDREAARRAGLGWYGKSSNLLLPGQGSWFVLGSVLTDAPLPPATEAVPDGCGSCRRCIDGCPTGAIVAPSVVDARRCLAWVVQAGGIIPRNLRVPLADRIYGCDECQEVCPPNQRIGRRAAAAEPRDAGIDLLELLALDDDELLARHGRWYIAERDPRYVRRNALVALGNVGDRLDAGVVEVIRRHLAHPDALLRAHAVWAARRLDRADLVADARQRGDLGQDAPEVAEELAAPPPPVRGPAPVGAGR